ncbi:FKBP-type peptidyl-prolyl cis-trans isomerase [Motiliproteus sp.]|uniref:FKBP-type peptidyl-prolyl cis-trans isomerase n=1 Tax=Motiliproteus sp. TaxID=1898955 RepID=UPI003BAC3DAA
MLQLILVLVAIIVLFVLFNRFANNPKAAAENVRLGDEFLAQNKAREGVLSSDSGLQLEVIQSGSGNRHPGPKDKVKVHYHGTLINGSVFDSSVERGEPIEFGLNQVIPGWTEGLQQMVVGEKSRLYIPSKLGYGNSGAGSIPPGSTLIFEVELLAINGEAD